MPAFLQRFSTRLVLGVFAAFLPIAAVMAFVLVTRAADALEQQAERGLTTAARTTAARVEAELEARRSNLGILATDIREGREPDDAVRVRRTYFEALQVLDRRGRVVGGDGDPLIAVQDEAFTAALAGRSAIAAPAVRDGTIRTVLTEPIGTDGFVAAGDLDESVLVEFLGQSRVGSLSESNIRVADGGLLWSTVLGDAADPPAMVRQGALRERALPEAARRGLARQTGAIRYTDARGDDVLGGYAPVPEAPWAVAVKQNQSEAFASVREQRDLALIIGGIGLLLAGLIALVFAIRTTRPVSALANAARRVAAGDLRTRVDPKGPAELRDLASSFNTMIDSLAGLAFELRSAGRELTGSSSVLSSASQELAATTSQQSAAAQQTTSTMEELSQTSAAIAGSSELVSARTEEMRGILERADSELRASSERLVELASRSNEIGRILTLINEIAEKTNLLSLNAAIEAARAGEAGAGFAVVAEEVRLLAERSKLEAGRIDEIVRGTQDDVSASVMALEAGSKEMSRGLEAMRLVAASTDEVQRSTDQQRVATSQVVGTMQSMSSATRQTAETAQQLTSAAGDIAGLAVRLDAAVQAFQVEADRRRGSGRGPAEPPAAAPPRDNVRRIGANGAAAGDTGRAAPPARQ